jgi:hypothetical protein
MSEPVLDCHHEDITHIVRLRWVHRTERRVANYRRYVRQYRRRR